MIRRAKSVKELYEEVKDYDLVITVDAPLRTALNRLLSKPTLGTWAVTPKELAAKHSIKILDRTLMDESESVVRLSQKMGISIKQVHHYVTRILNLWENYGSLDSIKGSLSHEELSIFELLKTLPTVHLAMENFDHSNIEAQNIAVIGINFFNKLDLKVLPDEYNSIDVFTDEAYDMPQFLAFTDENELVDRLVSMIDKELQDDIAIILDPGSSYLPLIRSKLINKGVDVNVRENIRDHFQVRVFMSLIDIGLTSTDLTVKEISRFTDAFSLRMDERYNSYLLSEYLAMDEQKSGELTEFYDLLRNITDKNYDELTNWLVSKKIPLPDEFIEILHYLALMEKKIDIESYTELDYYIRNFDIEMTRKKQGVLMVDCGNSAYVDRPVCFFIGLDSSWVKNANLETADRTMQDKNDLDSFQILIQQGDLRYYFVPAIKDNQSVTPCYYFNILSEKNIEPFDRDELFHARMIRNKENVIENMRDKNEIETKVPEVINFSQTSLNRFTTCPKQYMYSRLIPSGEQEYFLKGNLFHEYAAFYLEHTDIAKEKGENFFVDYMVHEYKRIADETNLDIERSRFRIGLDCLHSFIDSRSEKIDRNINLPSLVESKKNRNRFIDLFELPEESKNAELSFKDDEMHIEGIIDVMVNEVTIIDHKSSNKDRRPTEIIRESILSLINDEVDFQPMMYILEMRRNNPANIEFIYDYFLSNHRDVIKGTSKSDATLVTVKYYNIEFNEFLKTPEGIEIISSKSKARAKAMEKIGYDMIIRFFMENPMPPELQFDVNYEKIFDSEYRNHFLKYANRFADIRDKEVDDILKGIVLLRKGSGGNSALFFKDDIDEFESFLIEKHNELVFYIDDIFPCKPLSKDNCDKCEYIDICPRLY